MFVAKPIFVIILTLLISLSVSVAAFAAAEPKSKPKPKTVVGALGGFSLTPTAGIYSFSGAENRDPVTLYGLKIGYDIIGKTVIDSIGVEATFNYFTAKSKENLNDTTGYLIRLDAIYPFVQGVKWMPFLAVGAGAIEIDTDTGTSTDSEKRLLFNYGPGLKYFFQNYLAVRADGRHLIIYKSGKPKNNFELGIGVSYYFDKEREKKTPPPITKPKAKDEPKIEKKVSETILEAAIIPLAPLAPLVSLLPLAPPADSDSDGVIDTIDKCPATPNGVKVDSNGCPLDFDKDAVPDYLDKCPNTPAGVAVDIKGCPIDSDNDGVADYLDKCPATPAGVPVNTNGCSIEAAEKFCNPAIIAILFDTNKADIKATYHDELDKLGNFLKELPSSKGTIDGHTDSDGSKAANLKLSQARADRIRTYIIKKFAIDSKRIDTKGYGAAKPIASNKTEAGKAKNRRIEAVFSCE